jgi:predicted permease
MVGIFLMGNVCVVRRTLRLLGDMLLQVGLLMEGMLLQSVLLQVGRRRKLDIILAMALRMLLPLVVLL